MSLTREAFNAAGGRATNLNDRVNKLFDKLSLPLKDKVQMNHYGILYLFGNMVSEKTTDDELIKIIKSTPEKSWNGKIDFFGKWTDGIE